MRPVLGGELLGCGGVAGRRPEDRDVAQDDAGEVQLGRLGRGERGDEVDPVTVLERPDEQLVLVARDRDGALDALQLGVDAALGGRDEAPARDLLAGEDLVR